MEIQRFAELLSIIPNLEQGYCGDWADTGEHAGTHEDPLIMSYVVYTSEIEKKLIEEIYAIKEANPELGIHNYTDVLEENGFEWSDESLRNADISTFDATCLLAMIFAIVRADRFSEGILLRYLEEGIILGWLRRLKSLCGNDKQTAKRD